MPRSTALPHIPVKAKLVQRRITIDPELDANLSHFCEFYEAERGVRPDEQAVIVALLRDSLDRNRAFAKFLREKTKAKPAGTAP